MLSCAEGRENKAVAADLRTTEHTVARWQGWFIEGRLGRLHDEKRLGRPVRKSLRAVEADIRDWIEQ